MRRSDFESDQRARGEGRDRIAQRKVRGGGNVMPVFLASPNRYATELCLRAVGFSWGEEIQRN